MIDIVLKDNGNMRSCFTEVDGDEKVSTSSEKNTSYEIVQNDKTKHKKNPTFT